MGHESGDHRFEDPQAAGGSYFSDWLLDTRTRSERGFIQVVAEAYVRGVSTRRVEGLVETLGVASLAKSPVSELAKDLDGMVADFKNRPLDTGPYTYVWADALTMKVREGGRIVNISCLLAVGVNGEGNREILGVDLATSEDGAGWLAFFRSLTARGLTGTQLVISDDHPGVVDAIEATLVGAGWQPLPHPLFEEPVDQVPKSSETMAATRKPSSLNPTRTPYGPSFAVSSTILDRSDWSPPPSPRPCRSGDSDIHRVPQTALATDLVQQLPRTVEQRIQKMHKCCRHRSTRSRSFVSSGRFLSNNTTEGPSPGAR